MLTNQYHQEKFQEYFFPNKILKQKYFSIKDSFGFLRNPSKGQLIKSSTTLEDDFSSKKNHEIRNFEDYYEELELIGEVVF